METKRIDFISAYCDSWCELCPFTDRCSAFACKAAIAMCGDAEEGIELAVGRPPSPESNEGDREFELPQFVNPIQNDWNGSAKVALISIERSAEAWSALGTALGDAAAASLGDALGRLRRATVDRFPDEATWIR
jgi:hypothetical protein